MTSCASDDQRNGGSVWVSVAGKGGDAPRRDLSFIGQVLRAADRGSVERSEALMFLNSQS